MDLKKLLNKFFISLVLLPALVLTGCVDTREVVYFNGVPDSQIPGKTAVPESPIQKNDILSITVSSLNPEATAIFNPPSAGTSSSPEQAGYLVSSDGTIQFPFLGSIKADGLTKEQLKAEITRRLEEKQLLKDPIVTIRFLNYRVTVLGEVRNPSVLTIPNEKISLLQAIGMAGDLTINARRDNVLIIREEAGVKTLKRLNLNSDELLSSPYYYLMSNDIVYVEPNKNAIKSTRLNSSQMWVSVTIGFLSLAIILLDRIAF